MSRCLPYIRTNLKREDVSLIGSIKKLQNQWGNKKQRVDLSKVKKEIQNKKKRSREVHDKLDSLEHRHKKIKTEKCKFNETCHQAKIEESDHLERSALSEELDPPALVLSQSNSLEITQSSSKKNGLVLRIKLPLGKHKDLEPASAKKTIPHLSSPVTVKPQTQTVLTKPSSLLSKSSKVQSILTESESAIHNSAQTPKLSKFSNLSSIIQSKTDETDEARLTKLPVSAAAEPCFSGRTADVPVLQEDDAHACEYWHKVSGHGGSARRAERRAFRDLIINWKAPPIQVIEDDEGEMDWLFASKKKQSGDVKLSVPVCCKDEVSDQNSRLSSENSLQPRACYLPEFGIYQLPYVVPF